MSQNIGKHTFGLVHSAKIQISLHICTVWSESLLSVGRNFASLAIQNLPSEDSDQPVHMRRLIWIFTGPTCPTVHFLMLWHILLIFQYFFPSWSLGQWMSEENQEYFVTFEGKISFFTLKVPVKICGHSLLSADSRRAVVSFWRKNVHNTS